MTTPADELRAAAARLRALAADATPGPWFAHRPEPRHWGDADHDAELVGGGKPLAVLNAEYNGALNADYAAAMHPGVGKALADMLEAISYTPDDDSLEDPDSDRHDGCDTTVCAPAAALVVARLINQEQP